MWARLKQVGWTWKQGSGLHPYSYFRPGANTSLRKGALEGRDYFSTEAAVVQFVKSRRINGLRGRIGAVGEDTRRRAAEDDAALEAARERERAGRRTYRLVYGGRFGAWPVLSGRDLRSAPLTDLREGDGAVAPGGAATPRGGWVHVVAVKRADGTEEELARAGFCRLDATDDGRRQLYQDGEQPRAGVVRVSAALLQRCEAAADDEARAAVARELAGPRCGFDAARAGLFLEALAARARRAQIAASPAPAPSVPSAPKTPAAPTGSSIQPSRSYVHAPFANPRAKSCWLSCAFQVLWHSRAWHTCFEAALEAGALETSEWDTPGAPKIEALVDTWREYRATLASHAPPPPLKKARTGVDTVPDLDQADSVSPARLAEAFAPEGDRHGFGDTSDALSAVQRALDHPNVPSQARCLSDLYRIQPVPWGDGIDTARVQALLVHALATPLAAAPETPRPGAAPARPRRGRSTGAATVTPPPVVRAGASIIALDLAWPPTRDAARIEALARAFTPQPDAPIALYALVCYCHRLQHYVAYVKRQTSDAFLFFNDLPHLSGGARPSRGSKSKYANSAAADGPPEMRAAVTWDEAVRTCGRQPLQPRLVLYEDASHPSVARALDAIGGRK